MSRNNPSPMTASEKAEQAAELAAKYPHGYRMAVGGQRMALPDPESRRSQDRREAFRRKHGL